MLAPLVKEKEAHMLVEKEARMVGARAHLLLLLSDRAHSQIDASQKCSVFFCRFPNPRASDPERLHLFLRKHSLHATLATLRLACLRNQRDLPEHIQGQSVFG